MRTLRCALVLAALLLPACNTEITLSEGRNPGYVEVRPVNAAGDCVMGLTVEFTVPNGTIYRGLNAYDCYFATSGPPGTWTLTFSAPEGYDLAPTQENPVRVEVRGHDRTVVPVRLRAAVTGEISTPADR